MSLFSTFTTTSTIFGTNGQVTPTVIVTSTAVGAASDTSSVPAGVTSSSSSTPSNFLGTLSRPAVTSESTTEAVATSSGAENTSSATSVAGSTSIIIATSAIDNTSVLNPVSTSAVRGSPVAFTTSFNVTSTGEQILTFTGIVPVQKVKPGVSPGATAGIAIATALVGAAIAAIAMYVVHRKKKSRSQSSRIPVYGASTSAHKPAEGPVSTTKEKAIVTTTATDPDYLLPQPKDDHSVGTVATQLFVHIGNHVENFYHNDSLRDNVAPHSEEDELLLSRKTRHPGIKRYICREMLAAIAWDCRSDNSLLSATAVSMAQNMSRGNLDESTYEIAWSRWRVSTALLFLNGEGGQKAAARKFWLDRLHSKLQPFQLKDPESLAKIREDLHAICRLAETLGSTICSQPARWEFLWPRSDGRSHVVIFPEFVKKTDNQGRRLDRPRRVLESQRTQ